MFKSKREWRTEFLVKRAKRSPEQLALLNKNINDQLFSLELLKNARLIAGYLAFGHEINIDQYLFSMLQEKKVAVPLIVDSEKHLLEMVALDDYDDLKIGRYNIREPKNISSVLPRDLAVILVPGLAFDRTGGRLGLGAGYYDRYLQEATNAVKIGICSTDFLVEQIPMDEHDVFMDYIVTEKFTGGTNR